MSDGADWTSAGRLLQSRGPAAAKERLPTVTSLDGRTSRRLGVFSWDLNDAAESIERRLGLSEFLTDGTETEKALDAKLELTDGLKN